MVVRTRTDPKLIIITMVVSLLVAFVLNIYPLNLHIAQYRPLMVVSMVMFWAMYQPRYMGVFATLVIGLCADLLLNTVLGQQTVCLLFATLFMRFALIGVKQLAFFISWIVATLSLIVFQISFWAIQFILQMSVTIDASWSLVSSIVVWPILTSILYKFRS